MLSAHSLSFEQKNGGKNYQTMQTLIHISNKSNFHQFLVWTIQPIYLTKRLDHIFPCVSSCSPLLLYLLMGTTGQGTCIYFGKLKIIYIEFKDLIFISSYTEKEMAIVFFYYHKISMFDVPTTLAFLSQWKREYTANSHKK